MIPTPKGFLGSGQATGLPPKPDLSRYVQTRRAIPEAVLVTTPQPAKRPRRGGVSRDSMRGKVLQLKSLVAGRDFDAYVHIDDLIGLTLRSMSDKDPAVRKAANRAFAALTAQHNTCKF